MYDVVDQPSMCNVVADPSVCDVTEPSMCDVVAAPVARHRGEAEHVPGDPGGRDEEGGQHQRCGPVHTDTRGSKYTESSSSLHKM